MSKKIEISEEEIDEMADLFYALGDKKRVRTLVYMLQGMAPVKISEKLGIPRSSLQVHIEKLIQSHLLDRTGTRGEEGPYTYNEELVAKLLELGKKAGTVMSKLGQIKRLEELVGTLSGTGYGIDGYQELSSPLLEKTTKELELAKAEFQEILEKMK